MAVPAAMPEFLGALGAPVALALLLGAIPLLLLWWRKRSRGAGAASGIPEDGVFTLKVLKRFDGRGGHPLCLAVCGKVVDVSSSENIKYGEGYGALWAGCDATWALATLSLKAEEANRLDWKLEDLEPDQRTALAGWYKHFTTKYEVVGRLKEYDGWDFSSICELAKSQTPFGAKRTDGEPPVGAKASDPDADSRRRALGEDSAEDAAGAPAKSPQGKPVTFAKGEKVRLMGMERTEIEGEDGILVGFNSQKKCFEVQISDGAEGTEVVLALPKQLVKVEAPAEKTTEEEKKPAEDKAAGKFLPIGTRVWLFGMESANMSLEGAFGVIKGCNQDQGTYELLLDRNKEKAVVMTWQAVAAK